MQCVFRHAKRAFKNSKLVVEDCLMPILDFRDGTAADVQAFEPKLGRELPRKEAAYLAAARYIFRLGR